MTNSPHFATHRGRRNSGFLELTLPLNETTVRVCDSDANNETAAAAEAAAAVKFDTRVRRAVSALYLQTRREGRAGKCDQSELRDLTVRFTQPTHPLLTHSGVI